MKNKLLLSILIVIGLVCVGLGGYIILKPEPKLGTPNVAVSTPSSIVSTPSSTPESKPVATSRSFNLPVNQSGWQRVGSGKFSFSASGTIDYGGETANPDTSIRLGDDTAIAPGIPFGTIVGKIGGNGRPFKVGSIYKFNTEEDVYIAINDSNYTDNSGHYVITITQFR
jgi:hypothetical protein